MKAIKQKHSSGCGVACTAHILGLSYNKTLSLFKNKKNKAKSEGFLCREIIQVLNRDNKKYQYKYIKKGIKKKIYQDGVIVYIRKSKKYPAGHYLCRTNNYWMDSWINFQYSQDIKKAKAGFRKRLSDRPIYAILPVKN